MIHEVDEALRRLLSARALPGGTADIVFDAPTRAWATRREAPTVNAHLYDVREETAARVHGAAALRDPAGTFTAHRRPPRWFRLSYLLTAWADRAEDEHRLLSAVLSCLLPHESLPAGYLEGALADLGLTVPLVIGTRQGEPRSGADTRSALGGEFKPSLEVVVTMPVAVHTDHTVPRQVLEPRVAMVHDFPRRP